MIDKKPVKTIDWTNHKSKVSEHFTVHDCLYLPSWEIYHIPSEEEKVNLLKTVEKLELVREYLEQAIHIHVWIRPKCVNQSKSKYDKKNYNAAVGGAPGSAHAEGLAVDFHVSKMTCSEVRHLLLSKLTEFEIRMENLESNWIHIDLRNPLPNRSRFFKP